MLKLANGLVKGIFMRIILSVLAFGLFLSGATARAQVEGDILSFPPDWNDIPALKIIKQEWDVRIDYVGRKYSMDMWILSKGGTMQPVYTTLDGQGLLINGFLADPEGNIVTERQMSDFTSSHRSVVEEIAQQTIEEASQPDTPSERLWRDLSESHTIAFGSNEAPEMYVFVDPRCPYCKRYWGLLAENYVSDGLIQVHLVPVGILGNQSLQDSALLLDSSDPQKAWLDYVQGNFSANSKPTKESQDAVAENSALMPKWKMGSTPFTVYRTPEGKVKMMQGMVTDIAPLVEEMTP